MSALIAEGFAAWRECRADYELAMDAAYERAASECNDRLLNNRGQAAGITSRSLFMGSHNRAYAYASEELRDHWQRYPRITFEAFERQWMRGR